MNNRECFEKIVSVLKKYGAEKIAVFGSYAREENNPDSDIDIIKETLVI